MTLGRGLDGEVDAPSDTDTDLGCDFDLDAFLRRESVLVEAALERSLERWLGSFGPELAGPARHAVSTGGKRLRPILCAAAYEAVGGKLSPAVYNLGVSLELIHAYSLMHDDLPCMDDARLRRGKPTPHTMFGEGSTIRAGLALIPTASLQALYAAKALGCSDDDVRRIVGDLNRAAGAGGMVGGQALDLMAEGRSLGPDELDELHRMKTGALLTASLSIGGRAAGAPSEIIVALETFGRAIGLAFQIADDVLDATASAQDLGKTPSDVDLDKSTYVSVFGVEEARRRAQALSEESRQVLRGANVRSPALDSLAAFVVERKK